VSTPPLRPDPALEAADPLALAEALRGVALLGQTRRQVLRALPRLAAAAAVRPERRLEAELLALGGALALQDARPDAARQLAEAARAFDQAGLPERALIQRLRAARALQRGGQPERARDRVDELGAVPAGWREAAAERALFCSGAPGPEQRAAIEEALALLPTPGRDHDRFELHLLLCGLHQDGGDSGRARAELERAAGLAAAHGDNLATALVDARLGQLLLEVGLAREARAPLARAHAAADALGDDLSLVATASLLCAVLLGAGEWAEAEQVARSQLVAAERRGNWIGVADAAISWSATLIEREGWAAGVAILLRTARALRERAHEPSVNLLKARLAELRGRLGAERFDPLLRELSARV